MSTPRTLREPPRRSRRPAVDRHGPPGRSPKRAGGDLRPRTPARRGSGSWSADDAGGSDDGTVKGRWFMVGGPAVLSQGRAGRIEQRAASNRLKISPMQGRRTCCVLSCCSASAEGRLMTDPGRGGLTRPNSTKFRGTLPSGHKSRATRNRCLGIYKDAADDGAEPDPGRLRRGISATGRRSAATFNRGISFIGSQ